MTDGAGGLGFWTLTRFRKNSNNGAEINWESWHRLWYPTLTDSHTAAIGKSYFILKLDTNKIVKPADESDRIAFESV